MYQKNMFKSVISVLYCGPILLSTSGSLQTTGQITSTLTSVKTTNGETLTRNLSMSTFKPTGRSINRNIYVTTTMTLNLMTFNKTEFTITSEQPTSGGGPEISTITSEQPTSGGGPEISTITRTHSLTLFTILTKVFLPLFSVVLLFLLLTYLALVLREFWSRKRTLSDSSAGAVEEHGDVVNYKVHSEVIQSQLTQTKAAEKTSGSDKCLKTCHSQDDSYVNVQTMQGVNYDKISATLDQSEPYNNLVLYGKVLKTTRNVHTESTFLYVNTAKSSEYLNSQIVFDGIVNETIMYNNISEVSHRN